MEIRVRVERVAHDPASTPLDADDTTIDCTVWWSTPLPAAPEFLAVLDGTERSRFEGYRKQADRRRFLTGRVVAKNIMGDLLGLAPADVIFDATCSDCGKPHGRPHVRDTAEPHILSISHSGERIGVAVTAGEPVGLDVETASRDSVAGLVDYALNETERAALAELTEQAQEEAFFTYWARKEALMKASGEGLKIPLRSLTVSGPSESARLVASDHEALDPSSTRLVDLRPGDGYRASIAILTTAEVRIDERWWSL